MPRPSRDRLLPFLGTFLCLFTLAEVNYPRLSPQGQLAVFAMVGIVICLLTRPLHRAWKDRATARGLDWLLVALTVFCFGFVLVQVEPVFRGLWLNGQSLGHRAGQETVLDRTVGVLGILLVLEAARRALGWVLPALAAAFLAYAWLGPSLPDWLLPHRGYGAGRIVSQTFLHSQGVFGVALRVMFVYVFLFVLLGAFLERTGATRFVLDLARRLFGRSPGGAAKVAVIGSGMMGSLSGSAVANTATTGTFTIPMMRSAGFRAETAAGIEAAASSGGALVPPVMGAGAYMMLEIVDPPVTYLQIIKAALLPAILYYVSLFLIVHLRSKGLRVSAESAGGTTAPLRGFEAVVFVAAFAGLLGFLVMGFTVFRSVSLALGLGLAASLLSARTRLTPGDLVGTFVKASRDVVPLIAAAASVGIVLGVVTLTGVGTRFPSLLLPLAEESLPLALVLVMVSSIVLGMGLPSSVCYLLMATLVGPALGRLGVVPLAAHLFIFYFGMMSMVTPPVALAAYTAGSLARTNIMRTGLVAFRFALVGFALPYVFVFRPELLMLAPGGEAAPPLAVIRALGTTLLGIVPLAASVSGFLFARLGVAERGALLLGSVLLLFPGSGIGLPALGLALTVVVAVRNRRAASRQR